MATESKSSSKPVFTYFSGRGLGEFCRLVMVEGGVDYDDVRKEDIKSVKDSCVFGQVPLYEEDGFSLNQSHAIARYIASEKGLRGSTNKVAAVADMIIEGVRDMQTKYNGYRMEPQDKQADFKANFVKNVFPDWVAHFEKILKKSGKDYYAGEFTFADLFVFNQFSNWQNEFSGAFDKFPLVSAHLKLVAERPKIAKWLKARPVTSY